MIKTALLATLALLTATSSAAQDRSASQFVRVYAVDVTSFDFTTASTDIALDDVDASGRLVGSGQTGLDLATNLLGYKISGQLANDYADGVEVSAEIDFSGASLPVDLTPTTSRETLSATLAQDLAVGLTALASSDIVVSYEASAPLSVGTDYDETQEVIFTIVAVAAVP